MKLYWSYISIHLRSIMQHKASFFFTALGQFLITFSMYLTIFFTMKRYPTVAGFSFGEVSLCYAVVLMAFSLAECIARGFDIFPRMLGNGEFDRCLLRPRGAVFQVLASKFELTRLGRFTQAALMLAYALNASGVHWTWSKVLTLLLMIISGTATFACLFVIYASLSFFSTEGLEFMNILTDGVREHGSYPLAVYGKHVLRFFTYIVPVALSQYYPFLYLTGRTDNRLYILLPILSLVFAIPTRALWNTGLRHYKSTGS